MGYSLRYDDPALPLSCSAAVWEQNEFVRKKWERVEICINKPGIWGLRNPSDSARRMCACVFFLLAIMNEISCYRRGICSFVSNYSFCSSLHRLSIDLQEEGGRYTWGQGHLIATWEKNDVGPSGEICNGAIRGAKGMETKTEVCLHSSTYLLMLLIEDILWPRNTDNHTCHSISICDSYLGWSALRNQMTWYCRWIIR